MTGSRRHRTAQRRSLRGGPAPIVVRLAVCPDENHWILKPQNSRLWYQEFFWSAEAVLVFNVIVLRTH